MDKKELKVVDIDDLQPDDQDIEYLEEETVDSKVNIEDIRNSAPSVKVPGQKVLKATSSELVKKVDSSIIKSKRFKNYKGDGSKNSVVRFMSEKYRFDRKRYNKRNILLLGVLLFTGISASRWEDPFESMDFIGSLRGLPIQTMGFLYKTLGRFYIPLAFILVYLYPLKENTDTQVIIFYDGLIAPSEVFALGRPKKMRLKWSDIVSISYKNRYRVPFVQLHGKKNEIVAQIRLDFDDMDKFYEVLDTYCPEENPLRNLFTNTNKA